MDENNQGFLSMLTKTKKYRDLYKTIEGKISILGAIVLSIFISKYLMIMPLNDLNDLLVDLALTFIPCLIALLGVTFTGLAFVSGTVSLKATEHLFKEDKIKNLKSIFFTFYFLGWITAIAIFLYIIIFIAGISDMGINCWKAYILCVLTVYLTLFIILYTVGLFDTCIKIFFVNYKYTKRKMTIN